MDAKTHGKMTRGKLQPEARIDLHGMTLAEAHPELIRFILNAHAAGPSAGACHHRQGQKAR
jgi:DNA-nicking Smr family endonuclease